MPFQKFLNENYAWLLIRKYFEELANEKAVPIIFNLQISDNVSFFFFLILEPCPVYAR